MFYEGGPECEFREDDNPTCNLQCPVYTFAESEGKCFLDSHSTFLLSPPLYLAGFDVPHNQLGRGVRRVLDFDL